MAGIVEFVAGAILPDHDDRELNPDRKDNHGSDAGPTKDSVRYRGFRDRPPTVARILWRFLPAFLLLFLVVMLSARFLPVWMTGFYAGFAVGMIIPLVALAIRAVRIIPAFVEAMDWKKVDRMLGMIGEEEL